MDTSLAAHAQGESREASAAVIVLDTRGGGGVGVRVADRNDRSSHPSHDQVIRVTIKS